MKIRIENVRFSQVYIFEAGKKFDANSKEKFSIHGILERTSSEAARVKEAVIAACKEAWGATWETKLRAVNAAGKVWALRDGDTKVDKDGNVNPAYAGKLFVAAKNDIRPLILGGGPDGKSPLVAADGKPYPGSYGNLIIDIHAGDKPTPQVYAYLLGVQFVKDGERLSGGAVASQDDFDAIPGTQAAGATAPAAGAQSLF